jgi:hypothetical protein
VEFHPIPQLEAPAVGFDLLPAFYWTHGHYLKAAAVNPGEGIDSQLFADHMVDVAATKVVVDVQRSRLIGGDQGDAVPGAGYLLKA